MTMDRVEAADLVDEVDRQAKAPINDVRRPYDRSWGESRWADPVRKALIISAVAIVIFNIIDVLTTRALLHRGHTELNPLALLLIQVGRGALITVKVAFSATLAAYQTSTSKRSILLLALTSATAGTYFAIALGNTLGLLR
jgi:hypothetical protein